MLLHFSAWADTSAVPGNLPLGAGIFIENPASELLWGSFASFPVSLGNQTSAAGTKGYVSTPLNGILVPPGYTIEAQVNFTAPLVGVSASASIGAVLIPRGDIAWL